MNKITGSRLLLATLLPSVVVGSFALATSCSTSVLISTKTPEVNKNTGMAKIEVELPQQPADNQVMVTAITTSGQNRVLLIDEGGSPYQGHPSTFYNVQHRKFIVILSFKDYSITGADSKFDLQFSYLDANKQYANCEATGLELKVEYQHEDTEEIHLLSLNDFHGAAPGYGDDYFTNTNAKNPGAIRIANELNPIIESHPGSLFLTAGDNTSGETFSTCMHAQSMFPVLRSMGARYSAVGNHAFEWGLDPLTSGEFDRLGRTEDTIGNYLVTANIVTDPHKKDYEWHANPADPKFLTDFNLWYALLPEWADPYKIVNMNGHLVCLIGLTTQATTVDGNKSVVEHLSFIDYEAAICYTNYLCKQEIGDTWYNAIESFVLLTHVESDCDGTDITKPTGQAAKLAQELQYFGGVDAIISAHSHKTVCGTVYNPYFKKRIWVGQADTSGRKALDTKFYFDNKKPVGKRLDHVQMDLKSFTIASDYPSAQKELRAIRKNPSCESVREVINEYDKQKDYVKNKLFTVVAYRDDSLLYPICDEVKVGHEYFCSDQILDQLGAWICRGIMIGFASYYKEDIEEIPNVTWPSISFFNIDSANVQLQKPPKQHTPVTLKDIYSIQGYENQMCLGYLSVWQIGLIIDYLLSGKTQFNYDLNHEYFRSSEEVKEYPGRDLRKNFNAYLKNDPDKKPIECYWTDREWPKVPYKDGETRQCCYLCGPLQTYGIKYNIQPITDETEKEQYDRSYKLVYRPVDAEHYPELAEQYSAVPDIWILDPTPQTEGGLPYLNLDKPDEWKPPEYWLEKNKLISCVINTYTFNKGNVQAAMIPEYFKYNQELDSKKYEIALYSNLTREMLEEFCRLTLDITYEDYLHFDLSNDLVKTLVNIIE